MKKQYTEKEISVFKGVMALSKEGKKIYNVTVQDIAKAANVGKGTLYEYFTSKEEILLNTIVYYLSLENAKAQQIADSGSSFRDMIYKLYDLILDSFEDGFAVVSQIASGESILDIPRLISENKEYLDYAMSRRDKLVLQILRHGAEEGTIRMDFSQEYIVMAIMANLSCLNSCLHLPKAAEYIRQIEQKKDIAYTLLLKSLN